MCTPEKILATPTDIDPVKVQRYPLWTSRLHTEHSTTRDRVEFSRHNLAITLPLVFSSSIGWIFGFSSSTTYGTLKFANNDRQCPSYASDMVGNIGSETKSKTAFSQQTIHIIVYYTLRTN